jgi:uncharacterized protein YbjT (DUF2867 family)
VTGARGNVGRPTVEALRARGVDVVAAGVDVPFDFRDPTTWERALDGVDRLFLLRPPAISQVGLTLNALVDRARVEHVVFLSVVGAATNSIVPHAKVEAHLRAGPTPYTLLRAAFFAQNLTGPYRDDIREDGRVYVPAGAGAAAWVDTRDLGEVAAIAFLDPSARNAAWTLTGAEAVPFAQVAAALSDELGRPIRYEAASIPGYLRHLTGRRGLPLAQALVYLALHLGIRFGGEATVDPTLARVLGRPPRTVRDTIRDHRALFT